MIYLSHPTSNTNLEHLFQCPFAHLTQINLSKISIHTPLHLGLNVAAEPQTHGYMSAFSLSSPSNLPPPRGLPYLLALPLSH